jgi:hypothetical protein
VNGSSHYQAAERLLSGDAADQQAAQTHAILALIVAIREIGDQLDTLPRPKLPQSVHG